MIQPAPIYLFLCSLISEKSELSRPGYRQSLNDWCDFLGAEFGTDSAIHLMSEATREQAVEFKFFLSRSSGIRERGELLKSKAAPATVRKKIAILRKFYAELVGAGLLSSNPFFGVKLPYINRQKRPINMLPFNRVLELCNQPGQTSSRGLRDCAILAILYGGGLRVSEVEKLKIENVKETLDGNIYLHLLETKNGTFANQTIPAWAAEKLNIWKARRELAGAKAGDFLFCSLTPRGQKHRNRQMAKGSIFQLHRCYCEKIGLDPIQYSPHSARVTAISKLLHDGEPHGLVKNFSRHKSIEMVDRYDRNYLAVDRALGLKLKY